MEIQLPASKEYVKKIIVKEITTIRLPKGNYAVGDTITAFVESPSKGKIGLKITSIAYTTLNSVTVQEAEAEGFSSPDFCPQKAICSSIERRLDFEDYAFIHNGKEIVSKDKPKREMDLLDKVALGCQSCVIKKDPKDLFLGYWKSTYKAPGENPVIAKVAFEIIQA